MEYEEGKMYLLDLGDGGTRRAIYYRDGERGYFGFIGGFGFINEEDAEVISEIRTSN